VDRCANEIALFRKGALLVRARVLERIIGVADLGEGDSRTTYIDGDDAICRY
jgi:hypothetical protein